MRDGVEWRDQNHRVKYLRWRREGDSPIVSIAIADPFGTITDRLFLKQKKRRIMKANKIMPNI